jgi:hypothetical protein
MVGDILKKLNIILLLILVYNQTFKTNVSNYFKTIFSRERKNKESKIEYKYLNDEMKENEEGLDFQISE